MTGKYTWYYAAFIMILVALCFVSGCKKAAEISPVSDSLIIPTDTSYNAVSDTGSSRHGFYLTDYDTPPQPLKNSMPDYPSAYRESGIQGVVLLEVEVNESGRVDNVRVLKSLLQGSGGLDETAKSAVMNWTFKPALLKGKAVKAKVNIPIPFNLK